MSTRESQVPSKGAIAVDEKGCLGLILSDDASRWEYVDGEKVYGWDGIQLNEEVFGDRWFSANPVVLGHTSGFTGILQSYITGAEVMSEALDSIWADIYPDVGKNSSWEYPGQVAAHVRCVLQELNYKPGSLTGSKKNGETAP